MPLILILRFLFSLMSLAILAGSAYLLWRWYEGYFVEGPDGVVRRVREEWPLWVGLGLLAWSFAGGLIFKPLLATPDKRVLKPAHSGGRTIQSPTGSSLYVQMHGAAGAPAIVLTHGWSLDSSIWGYAIEDLQNRFRVITWDLPEMGRSKGHVDLPTFAKDLQAVIASTAAERVVLVGHSIGGMTIQTLARDNPDFVEKHVAGIVLLNTTYTNPLRTMILSPLWRALRWPLLEPLMWLATPLQPLLWLSAWQSYLSGSAHLANRIGFGKYVSRSQLNMATLLATKNPPGAQARGCLAMFRWDAADALSALTTPVLVIGGELDIVTKPKASQAIADSAARSELTIVDDVNHMGFLERFETYNEQIARFAHEAHLSISPAAVVSR
jgi:pimeloyl-ACP methyl ester carboxylesterase